MSMALASRSLYCAYFLLKNNIMTRYFFLAKRKTCIFIVKVEILLKQPVSYFLQENVRKNGQSSSELKDIPSETTLCVVIGKTFAKKI